MALKVQGSHLFSEYDNGDIFTDSLGEEWQIVSRDLLGVTLKRHRRSKFGKFLDFILVRS